MDLLSLRLVGVVGARVSMRSSYAHQEPALAWIKIQALTVASPMLLATEVSCYFQILN